MVDIIELVQYSQSGKKKLPTNTLIFRDIS